MPKTIILQNPTRENVLRLELHTEGTKPVADVQYYLVSETGAKIKYGLVRVTLTPAQITSLRSFVDSAILPAIITQEGL